MLYSPLDNHARTSTELAVIAGVSPATASVHLNRLKSAGLVRVLVQGKHRYYSLEGAGVAGVLESLSVLAGDPREAFVPNTPASLRGARTCYDHMAGTLGVLLHDRLLTLGWLITDSADNYLATPKGIKAFDTLGVDIAELQSLRRRFAFGCLDWSERRFHLGGAVGAGLLNTALKKKWVSQDLDSRILSVTSLGRRELLSRFELRV